MMDIKALQNGSQSAYTICDSFCTFREVGSYSSSIAASNPGRNRSGNGND